MTESVSLGQLPLSVEKEGTDEYDFCAPCGVCRQVMMEFCNPDEFEIVLGNSAGDIKVIKLKDMLPMGFGPENLE